jgi:hypothetical protein
MSNTTASRGTRSPSSRLPGRSLGCGGVCSPVAVNAHCPGTGCDAISPGGFRPSASVIRGRLSALAYPPKVGAGCGNAARPDLCGGRRATGVPAATNSQSAIETQPNGMSRRVPGSAGGERSSCCSAFRPYAGRLALRLPRRGTSKAPHAGCRAWGPRRLAAAGTPAARSAGKAFARAPRVPAPTAVRSARPACGTGHSSLQATNLLHASALGSRSIQRTRRRCRRDGGGTERAR